MGRARQAGCTAERARPADGGWRLLIASDPLLACRPRARIVGRRSDRGPREQTTLPPGDFAGVAENRVVVSTVDLETAHARLELLGTITTRRGVPGQGSRREHHRFGKVRQAS